MFAFRVGWIEVVFAVVAAVRLELGHPLRRSRTRRQCLDRGRRVGGSKRYLT